MVLMWHRLAGIVLVCSLGGSSSLAFQARGQSVSDGVYTEQQAARGQAVYKGRCANCHGDTLGGRTGPPLAGSDFIADWEAQPLLALAGKIRNTMPKDDTAKLTPQEAADVLAYILQVGKFPSGTAELLMDDAALQRMNFPLRSAAKSAPPSPAPQLPSLPPSGNVAQVMRGILFPSANIIFTVQGIDPGAKKPAAAADTTSDTGGFDWLAWGGGIYKGWDVVDYAAVSLSESATLMLTPGRRCENGALVPVSDPDWIKYTLELADAGKAAYKASQSRNQEAVSVVTNQVNDSCANCHRVFRGRTHCAKV